MRTLLQGKVYGGDNPEDAISRIRGVAQVLDHFSMSGGVSECADNGQMFGMLAAVLYDASAELTEGIRLVQREAQ